MPRKNEPLERTCALTREVKPVSELLRFVEAPDGTVVPDIKGVLPGRGVWITATAEAVDEARKARVFARGLKSGARAEPDLAGNADALLEKAALGALSLTRKAGEIVTGFSKVEAALKRDPVAGLVEARDGAEDGKRKLAAIAAARFGSANGCPVVRLFTSAQLDLALGRSNVIHAALLEGRTSEGFLTRARRLERFRGGPDGPARQEMSSAGTQD